MQIVIDKESLVRMLKVSLYAITGADYKDIGETVNELLDKVGYVELPKGHGNLVDYEELKNNAREYSAYAEATLSHIKPEIIIEADNDKEREE